MRIYQLVKIRLVNTPIGQQLHKEVIYEDIHSNDAVKYAIKFYKYLGIDLQQPSIFDYHHSGEYHYQLRRADVLMSESITIVTDDRIYTGTWPEFYNELNAGNNPSAFYKMNDVTDHAIKNKLSSSHK